MATIKVSRLTNANLYVDGASHLGKAEEINFPDITYKMSEHKAIGMYGAMELPSGIDKMEATIKWNSFYDDVMKKFASPLTAIDLQARGNLEAHGSGGIESQKPFVAYIKGFAKNFPMGSFKQHDNVEMTSKISVTYAKIEIDGVRVFEFDAMSNILFVGDEDVLATYRNNIGG